MIERREPILMCATGKKGVGKTYTTMKLIKDYIKPNKKTGKKARKVLIYDIESAKVSAEIVIIESRCC